MKKYYDPEYDRIVTEDVIKEQYDWFVNNAKEHGYVFKKTYEEFRGENFMDEHTDKGEAFKLNMDEIY